jgi:MoaA/NifB/PqqE/SkfB family radical SAM enzyme
VWLVGVGLACNNRCVFCAQGGLSAPSEPDPRRALEAAPPGSVVAFVGGEPTLRADLAELVALADQRAAAIVIQTNGRRLAYRGYVDELLAASPRVSFEVALQGSSAPMHDYHTGVAGSFGQTVKGLANLRSARARAWVTTVITRSSFRHLVDVVRLSASLGATAHALSPAAALGRAAEAAARVVPAPELTRPHVERAIAEGRRLGLRVITHEPEGVAEGFVGLGEVAPRGGEAPLVSREEGRVSLRVASRPNPGLGEVRLRDKRSGDELRAILPMLFEDQAGPRPGRG